MARGIHVRRGSPVSDALDRRRYDEADIEFAQYIRPAGTRGFHVVRMTCNEQEFVVGGPRATFKPGSSVPIGSHTGNPGKFILASPPPGRRGASGFKTRTLTSSYGTRACPLGIANRTYLAIGYNTTSRTLYAWQYLDGAYVSTIKASTYTSGLTLSGNRMGEAKLVPGTTMVAFKGSRSGTAYVVSWDYVSGTVTERSTGISQTDYAGPVPRADGNLYGIESVGSPAQIKIASVPSDLSSYTALGTAFDTASRYALSSNVNVSDGLIEAEIWDTDTSVEDAFDEGLLSGSTTLSLDMARSTVNYHNHGSASYAVPVNGNRYVRVHYYAHGQAAGADSSASLTITTAGSGDEEALWPAHWNLAPSGTVNVNTSRTEAAVYPVRSNDDSVLVSGLMRVPIVSYASTAAACSAPYVAVESDPSTSIQPAAMIPLD